MTNVEIRQATLGGKVETVLREVWIPRAREEVRRIVDRLGPSIRRERREAARQSLLKTSLKRVIVRVRTRLEQIDVVKTRIRPRHERQSRRQHTRLRLVNVASRQQLRAFRANVCNFEHAAAAEPSFHVEVPVLHVTGAQIALNRERRIRERKREERRKRIGKRERQ